MLTLLVATALAGTDLQITVDHAAADALGVSGDDIEAELAAEVERVFRLYDQEGFLGSMADAAAIAGKGIGADYASNPETFVFGAAIGTGANAQGLVLGRGQSHVPEAGFAVQLSAMAGLNLGVLAGDDEQSFLRRITLSAHGMALTSPQQDIVRGSMYNAGGHVQVKLVGKGNHEVLEWGGLDLTAGYERSGYRLTLEEALPVERDLGGGATMTWDADGAYSIDVHTDSIPVELSTNLRVSVLTLFLGAGVDLVTGRAASLATLGGPIEVDAGGEEGEVGSVSLALDWEGVPDPVVGRVFVGPQINVWVIKVYAQVSAATNASVGAHAGLRFAW